MWAEVKEPRRSQGMKTLLAATRGSGVSIGKRLPRPVGVFDVVGGGHDWGERLPKHPRGFDLTPSEGESNASAAVGGDNPPRGSDPNRPGIKLVLIQHVGAHSLVTY